MRTDVLVVGAAVAAAALVRRLRDEGGGGSVMLLDRDPDGPYDRPPLSKEFLTSQDPRPDAPWWDSRCEVLTARAVALDVEASRVRAVLGADGEPVLIEAGTIVVATGASPISLPGEPAGVAHLRTAADARRIRGHAAPGRHVVVLGAGTVGTELASTLATTGARVTLVERADRPLDRFLAGHLGQEAEQWIRDAGVDLHLGTSVLGISALPRGWVVDTTAGRIEGDLVVSAVGTRPEVSWLADSGLDVSDGVRCDERGTARDRAGRSVPHVFAIGDVAAWDAADGSGPRRREDWTSAQRQGRAVADTLLGRSLEPAERDYYWSQQFGRRIQILGTPRRDGELVRHSADPARGAAFHTVESASGPSAWIAINSPREFAFAMREALAAGR